MSALDELPDEVRQQLRQEYAGVYDEQQLERHVRSFLGTDVADAQVVLLSAIVGPGSSVLDVGCGYGAFVAAAARQGFAAVGVERAPVELRHARRTAGRRIVDGDGLRLPVGDGAVDAVTLWNVLEHVEDVDGTLREAGRVLRPGGTLVAIAPNYAVVRREAHYHLLWAPGLRGERAARYLRARGRDPRFFLDQVRPCTNRQVRAALRRHGFEVRSLTAAKLRAPAAVAGGRSRRIAELLARTRTAGVIAALVELGAATPWARDVAVIAAKRP